MKVMSPKLLSPAFLLSLLGFTIAATITIWFFYSFEKKPYTVNSGESPQARANQLLAAEEYLQHTGLATESVAGMDLFASLPPVTDAILIRHFTGGISNSISSSLLQWVEHGGHLLVVYNHLSSEHPGSSDFFAKIGVGPVEDDSNCGCPPADESQQPEADQDSQAADMRQESLTNEADEHTEEQATEKTVETGPYRTLIDFEFGGHHLQAETTLPPLLDDLSESAATTISGSYFFDYEISADSGETGQDASVEREGAWLLQYHLGEGVVTVMSEMDFLLNRNIGEVDHAFFLSLLTENAGKIWLLYSTNVDSFLQVLWQKSPQFWLSALIALVMTVWHMQLRIGPRLYSKPNQSENIIAHIDATANYNWRVDTTARLVNLNRRSIQQNLTARNNGAHPSQRIEEIDLATMADKTGMEADQLNTAFHTPMKTEQDLIIISRALQHIKNHLSGGDKRER